MLVSTTSYGVLHAHQHVANNGYQARWQVDHVSSYNSQVEFVSLDGCDVDPDTPPPGNREMICMTYWTVLDSMWVGIWSNICCYGVNME